MHVPEEAWRILAWQDNVIATRQVAKPSARAMREAHNRGHWRQLAPGVYLAAPHHPSDLQRMWAAVLYAAPNAALAGRAALVVAGWTGGLRWPIDVLGTGHRRHGPAWVRVHRTSWLPERHPGSPPACNPNSAVVQAAAWAASDREAMFLVISALQQRVAAAGRILDNLSPTQRRASLIRRTVYEYTTGADSLSEVDFAALCGRHGLPQPVRQTRRRSADGTSYYTDAEFRTASGGTLIVEIDGAQHLRPETWAQGLHRQNELVLATSGRVLRVATVQIRIDPGPFMQQLRRAIAEG